MSTLNASHETLFGRIGRALRQMARNYVEARKLEARRFAIAGLDEHALQDIGVDRYGTPYNDFTSDLTLPAGANDDRETRRAA